MNYTPLEREPDDHRTPLTAEEIKAMCRRGFGSDVDVESVQELAGGTFNSTFLITFANPDNAKLVGADRTPKSQENVVLRVAPKDKTDPFWNHPHHMRSEVQIQPYFAAIAHLMPTILRADFTRQILDRDYMFQSYLEGERWDDIEGELSNDEHDRLWYQFGTLLHQIHSTTGDQFGWSYLGQLYDSWSDLIITQFEHILQDLQQNQIDSTDFESIFALVRANQALLDEIQQPHLLHGDLWTFNILVTREADEPDIVGVLDADYAWWGDPLADWTMLIWEKGSGAEMHRAQAAFWAGYGGADESPNTRFRAEVYNAMYSGMHLLLKYREGSTNGVARARRELEETKQALFRNR